MIGAILGDIIGSPYEFDRGNKSKEFPLFSRESTYTDDTVMTLAVSLTFLDAQPSASDDWILQNLANRMRQFGKMYPNAGYGGMFRQWLRNPECKAYNIDKDDYSICEWYELENVRYFYDFFKKHEKEFE